jgi:hypothetical protein
VRLFVAGGSGQAAGSGREFASEATFGKDDTNGFSVLEADQHSLTIRFIDDAGKQMYETTLHK